MAASPEMLRRRLWTVAAALLLLLGASRVAANTEGEPLHRIFIYCYAISTLLSGSRLPTDELVGLRLNLPAYVGGKP
jgi:hypothetical protein